MSEPRVLCSIRLNHVHARTKIESCLVKDPTTSTAIARGILHLCLDTETVFRDAILRFSGKISRIRGLRMEVEGVWRANIAELQL